MSQNCFAQNRHLLHEPGVPASCATSISFMLNKSSAEVQSTHLKHFQVYLQSVHSFIVVPLQPPIHLIKIGGLTPISLNHLSSWFCGPPICSSNLSLVSLKCQCGGVNMYLLAMDFPWNAPFSVHPTTLPVLIGGDYGVFVFLLGVGTQPVGTLPLWGGLLFLLKLWLIRVGAHKCTLTIRLDRIRLYL